ncbi:hypothetical protein SDJN03_00843, partial [Cucurbita argyrosperma subsp. sororia]
MIATMGKKLICVALLSFLLLSLVSNSHSMDQSKTCPQQFRSTGTCAGWIGISECYSESMARNGNIPPKGCKCIPDGVDSRICRCNVVCH